MSRLQTVFAHITPRQVLVVTGVVVLTLVLTVALRNTVRELVVVPISALFWAAGILINSVPQVVWLGVLVVIGAIIAIRSLAAGTGAKPPEATRVEAQSVAPTRLAFWVGRLSDNKRSAYTAERALNEMRALVVDCLAHDQRVPAQDVLAQARKGELDVPDDVRALLLEDFAAQPERASWLHRFRAGLSSLLARLGKREVTRDTTLLPEFQRKVTVMLNYVEAMGK